MRQFFRSLLLSFLYSAALTFLLNFVVRPLFKKLWNAIYLRRHPKAAGWLEVVKSLDPDVQHGRLVADTIVPDKLKPRRRILFLPLILFVGLFSNVHLQWFSPTTYTAASASYADVSYAYGLCSDGDTLSIPADSKTWTSTLTVTKAITMQGAGKALTLLNGTVDEQYLILQPGSNKAQRVTGIGFIGGGVSSGGRYGKIYIAGSGSGSYVLDKIRIDHCDFENHKEAIFVSGWVESLIDHNSFTDNNRTILIKGDDDSSYSWSREIAAGTSHSLFIEDNTFVYTNNHVGLDQWIYHQEGGRTVVRYNTFTATAETGADCACFDSHGNQNYWTGGTDFRGQPLIEIYNNTFAVHHTYQFVILRGGSIIMHDNALTYITSGSNPIQLGEEEGDPGHISWFNPTRTAWPAQDQINNSFFWNNTLNGTTITDVTLWFPSTDPTFIQSGRDYWMAQPAASGGHEYYTGARQGGSQTDPTSSDTGSMAFTGSGANAYYPYTPYTYPHPLQGGGGGGGGGSLIMGKK
jgi:hypothetical protein